MIKCQKNNSQLICQNLNLIGFSDITYMCIFFNEFLPTHGEKVQ